MRLDSHLTRRLLDPALDRFLASGPEWALHRLAQRLVAPAPLGVEPGWRFATSDSYQDWASCLRRSLWRTYRDRGLQRPVRLAWLGDLQFELHLGNDLSHCLYVGGSFEPNELVLLQSVLQPGATFLDGGANVGLFTLFASRCVGPSGRVLAVEPSPRELARLRRNLELNRFPQATVHELALAEASGEAELVIAAEDHECQNALGAISNPTVRPLERLMVPVRSLDDLVDELGLARLDVVKLDVEGCEAQVLRGARRTLARFRPLLQLEIEAERLGGQGETKDAVLELLAEHGYETWVFDAADGQLRRAVPPGEPEGNAIAAPAGWVPPLLAPLRAAS